MNKECIIFNIKLYEYISKRRLQEKICKICDNVKFVIDHNNWHLQTNSRGHNIMTAFVGQGQITFSNTSEILIFLPLWTWVNGTKKQNGPAQNINIMEYQGFFLRRPSMRWTLPEKNKLNFTVNITECKVILRSQPTTSYLSLTQAKHLKNLELYILGTVILRV